eukprot:TRINITY_DN6702_c0_g1_i13.p1 TRINITY_DN6702_c0_g1~~TRINITY_DN6702_c0_g1_i13.p1  ORF type:complete len:1481 (-),score=188.81 TRINITY_DN6702_c0_g1_i13:153-4595(-)
MYVATGLVSFVVLLQFTAVAGHQGASARRSYHEPLDAAGTLRRWQNATILTATAAATTGGTLEEGQLEVLLEIWQSLKCSHSRWDDRTRCPSWASCSGGNSGGGLVLEIDLSYAGCRGAMIIARWRELYALQKLNFTNNGLRGSLPAAWSELSRLQQVDLSSNSLKGALPVEWAALHNLQVLDLSRNELTGELPQTWCELALLQKLSLSHNKLSGGLPSSWYQLATLHSLFLEHNKLTGQLPVEWSRLQTIHVLQLHHNTLSGPLPAEWRALSSLTRLGLSHNMLVGRLPGEWCELSNLTNLGLNTNQLEGVLPTEWYRLSRLERLYLRHNKLDGPLPVEWRKLNRLEWLVLSKNKLSGQLPSEWGHWGSLQEVYLDSNELSGPLPAQWHMLSRLRSLNLRLNKLTQQLPTEWSQLGSLAHLYVDRNKLHGSLPAEWGDMASLRRLSLNQNRLTGRLPSEWAKLGSLEQLWLCQNMLTGQLPATWASLRHLWLMWLNNNKLTGPLPAEWGSLDGLRSLYLHNNELNGTLPSAWRQLRKLPALSLSSNLLHGQLPPEWAEMRSLRTLEMQNNELYGPLPGEWSKMTGLEQLSIPHNYLSGPLPPAWGKLANLKILNLYSNELTGALPVAWQDLSSLQELKLTNNKVGGSLPAAWSKLRKVQQLKLAANRFEGVLPPEWSALKDLHSLFLQMNNISGALPAEWAGMQRLERLQLDGNRISGFLPREWGKLPLKKMSFGKNYLHGPLPPEWKNMRKLTALNLNYNRLTGSLPSEWSCMRTMKFLRVHHNNLHGYLNLFHNELNGPFPVSWTNLRGLRVLDLGSNRLTGEMPSGFSALTELRSLILHRNGFKGPFPDVSGMLQMRDLLAYANSFSGPLPRLLSTPAKGGSYRAVLLHNNKFAGRFDAIGNPDLRLLLALPGNHLGRPEVSIDSFQKAAKAEPFIGARADSALFRSTRPPTLTLLLPALAVVICLFVHMRLPSYTPLGRLHIGDLFLRRNFAALRSALLAHAFLAAFLGAVYRWAQTPGFANEFFNQYAATYCQGNFVAFAFVCMTFAAASYVQTLLQLPRHVSQSSRMRLVWSAKCSLWFRVILSTILTSWPALLNVFVNCSPYVPDILLHMDPYLPLIGAILHVFVQPPLLRKIARAAKIAAYELQVLQQVSAWVLPLATVVVLSPSCYGAWWQLMPECRETTWRCEHGSGPHGWLTYCTSENVFDIQLDTECSILNSTHCILGRALSAAEICSERWSRPASCTASAIDIVGMFIFEKFLVACVLTPTLLLVSSFARSELPWWAVVGLLLEDGPDGARTSLAVQGTGIGLKLKLVPLSAKFYPPEVLQRLSVWADLSFSWGLLYPPIAIAGLGHVFIEAWCYERAVSHFRYRWQHSREVFQIPRATMLTWFMAANVVAALHVASVVREEPDAQDVASALAMVVFSWVAGFWRGCRQVAAVPELEVEAQGVELARRSRQPSSIPDEQMESSDSD